MLEASFRFIALTLSLSLSLIRSLYGYVASPLASRLSSRMFVSSCPLSLPFFLVFAVCRRGCCRRRRSLFSFRLHSGIRGCVSSLALFPIPSEDTRPLLSSPASLVRVLRREFNYKLMLDFSDRLTVSLSCHAASRCSLHSLFSQIHVFA